MGQAQESKAGRSAGAGQVYAVPRRGIRPVGVSTMPPWRCPANADVETTPERGRGVRARRRDVFDRLLAGPALEAVRRLQRDLTIARALAGGVAAYAERIDRGPGDDAGLDSRLRAGERVRRALLLSGPASARLIEAVCEGEAALGRPVDWRAIVERETGERLADAQGAVLRAACGNLAGAYAALDRKQR